jgi:hypothetical protein
MARRFCSLSPLAGRGSFAAAEKEPASVLAIGVFNGRRVGSNLGLSYTPD